jgi:hypothetical protein
LDDIFGNTLSVSEEIHKALSEKGLVYRWISMKKFSDNGNSHEYGWRPVKRSECANVESSPNDGNDPNGFIRRGDLVLGVRSKVLNDQHNQYLRQEAQRSSSLHSQKRHAEELRKHAESQGIRITEGYDDDEK